MPKNTIRDILPPEHRPQRRSPQPTNDGPMHRSFEATREPKRINKRPRRNTKSPYLLITFGSIIGVVILAFIFSFLFGGAQVSVTPKTESLTVNGEFTAYSSKDNGLLVFETMMVEVSDSVIVPATGSSEVETKSSGQIVIYNNYNSKSQRLIRNTRFESPDGLIYRINKSVVVPGQTEKDGKKVPGSIEVTVYADEAGDGYNIGLTDFTIPGFEGSPQFEGFYARSKTEMTGGFVGEKLVVEETILEQTIDLLHERLALEVADKSTDQKPEGFITFDGMTFIRFVSEPTIDSGENVEIREKVVLYTVIFDERDLAQHVAENTLGSFDNNPVTFINKDDLKATIENKEEVEPWSDLDLSFTLVGTASIEWIFDENRLKEDLAGRNKAAIHTILGGYPSIDTAEVIIRPFWKGSFPEDVNEIEIIKN